MTSRSHLLPLAAALLLGACSSFGKDELPKKSPPLADMEEPVALLQEPKDEDRRKALPLGSFTGVTVAEARRSLDETESSEPGVRVSRVVENSPGDAAGIEEDDLLLAVTPPGGAERALRWPSEWRKVEIDTPSGAVLHVVLDRAGVERTAEVRTVARVRAGERTNADRFREEQRVGVVLRTATEVEARASGLGPGGGAVVVGLSAASPWRAAGLQFGDVIVSVDGQPLGHPQQLIEAIRSSEPDVHLTLEFDRAGERRAVEVALTRREQQVRSASIPFVYSYENDRGMSETSILMGLFRRRATAAAWEIRLLWFIDFSGGDADRLVEVDE